MPLAFEAERFSGGSSLKGLTRLEHGCFSRGREGLSHVLRLVLLMFVVNAHMGLGGVHHSPNKTGGDISGVWWLLESRVIFIRLSSVSVFQWRPSAVSRVEKRDLSGVFFHFKNYGKVYRILTNLKGTFSSTFMLLCNYPSAELSIFPTEP